nr:hypothetical protein Iba_chr10dCG10270 [Ipomoea batatas]
MEAERPWDEKADAMDEEAPLEKGGGDAVFVGRRRCQGDAVDEEAPLEKEVATPWDEEAMSWMRRRPLKKEEATPLEEEEATLWDEEAMPWMRRRPLEKEEANVVWRRRKQDTPWNEEAPLEKEEATPCRGGPSLEKEAEMPRWGGDAPPSLVC